MSVLKTKPRFGPDDVVVATVSMAAGNDVVRLGDLRRGGDQIVRDHPAAFVPDGTPQSEWPSPWPDVEVDHAPEFVHARQRPLIAVDGVVICTTSFTNLVTGVAYTAGTLFHPDDPAVHAHSEYFGPVRVPDPRRACVSGSATGSNAPPRLS